MISSVATFSWSSVRLRPGWRLPALALVALVGGALISAPWTTLTVASICYVLSIPFSMRSYARVMRLRGGGKPVSGPSSPAPDPAA